MNQAKSDSELSRDSVHSIDVEVSNEINSNHSDISISYEELVSEISYEELVTEISDNNIEEIESEM